MALTRTALSAMGIEEAQADEIIKMHTDVVNEIKDERDGLKDQLKDYDALQKKVKTLEDEAKQGDRSPYKKKYEDLVAENEALQKEFDSFKADTEAKATKAKQKKAYKKLLADAGVSDKFIDFVIKNAEADGKFAKLEFEEDGGVKDAEALSKAISEDYASFIPSKEQTGVQTPKPPANEGGQPSGQSRAAQLAAKYHADLYGEPTKEG